MKNKLTRKLMLSAFTLLFAVISLGASTYAWFTMSTKAEVEAFEAQVKAGEGIEIAVTSGVDHTSAQWYTGIVPADVVQAAANPLTDGKTSFRFEAISTVNAKSFLEKDMETEAQEGFISFYIHIKVAEIGTVKLSEITLTGEDLEWEADAAYQLTEAIAIPVKQSIKYNVANAARVALAQVTNKVEGDYTIYENNALTPSAENAGNQVGQNGATYTYEKDGETLPLGALSYYNSKNDVELDYKNAATYTATQVGTLATAAQSFAETTAVNQVITLHVKVWIEGWDVECLNALFNDTLKVAFKFNFEPKQKQN